MNPENPANPVFVYNVTLKLNELPSCAALDAFPGVTDVAVSSKGFVSYAECTRSANTLMNDVVQNVNGRQPEQFTVSTEANPSLTGVATRSTDWGVDELARLWIFNKREEGARNIHAVGQARIFKTVDLEPKRTLN